MQYDFTLNANGGGNIDATGEYVKYKSGLGAIRVKFSTGGYVDLTPGQGIRVQKRFNSINLTDRSGNANQGVLVVGDVEFQDDTIAGTVSVVDGARNSTLSKACFLGGMWTGTVAGNYNATSLINPTDSGKNVFVEAVYFSTSSATDFKLCAFGMGPQTTNHAGNKYLAVSGGVQSKAFIEQTISVTDIFGSPIYQTKVAPNTVSPPLVPREPIMIPPGMGLLGLTGTIATGAYVFFEFREDPI